MAQRTKLPILHLKILLPISLAMAFVLGASGYYAIAVEREFLRKETFLRARALLGALEVLRVHAVATDDSTRLADYIERLRVEEKDVHAVTVLDRTGTRRLGFTRPSLPPGSLTRSFVRKIRHQKLYRGEIILTVSPQSAAGSIQRMTKLIVLAVADAVLLIGLLLHLLLKSWISRPLNKFLDFAVRIKDGDLEQRVAIRSRDEIGDLAAAFDGMAESLARSRLEIETINRELEARVLERTREVAAILESLSDGLVVVDPKGRVTRLNPAASRFLGCDGDQCVGRSYASVLHDVAGEGGEEETEARPAQGEADGETFITRADGTRVPVLLSRAPMTTPDGTVAGEVISFRDITRIRELHQQIRRSDRLSSVGVLAAGVAHELNNPLANISTFTQLLEESSEASPEFLASSLAKIRHEVDRAGRIVRNLLEFSRQAPPQRKLVDPSALVEATTHIVRPSLDMARITLELHVDPNLPMIEGDWSRLQQVIINLLTNAVHAIGRDGTVSIRVSAEPLVRKGAPFLAIAVEDTGPGMDEDTQARIFDPFFTTKDVGEGTGLGLSVSYGIVADHGGTIEVRSEAGKGTTFTVLLPWPKP